MIKYLQENSNLESILKLLSADAGNLSNVTFAMKKRIQKAYYNCSWWKPLKCEICDKIFERKYELGMHITIVHDGNL